MLACVCVWVCVLLILYIRIVHVHFVSCEFLCYNSSHWALGSADAGIDSGRWYRTYQGRAFMTFHIRHCRAIVGTYVCKYVNGTGWCHLKCAIKNLLSEIFISTKGVSRLWSVSFVFVLKTMPLNGWAFEMLCGIALASQNSSITVHCARNWPFKCCSFCPIPTTLLPLKLR